MGDRLITNRLQRAVVPSYPQVDLQRTLYASVQEISILKHPLHQQDHHYLLHCEYSPGGTSSGCHVTLAELQLISPLQGTYYAIGAAWIMTLANYFAIGWFNGTSPVSVTRVSRTALR